MFNRLSFIADAVHWANRVDGADARTERLNRLWPFVLVYDARIAWTYCTEPKPPVHPNLCFTFSGKKRLLMGQLLPVCQCSDHKKLIKAKEILPGKLLPVNRVETRALSFTGMFRSGRCLKFLLVELEGSPEKI